MLLEKCCFARRYLEWHCFDALVSQPCEAVAAIGKLEPYFTEAGERHGTVPVPRKPFADLLIATVLAIRPAGHDVLIRQRPCCVYSFNVDPYNRIRFLILPASREGNLSPHYFLHR